MKVTADSNVLLRIILEDDVRQAKAAQALVRKAEAVIVSPASLCEVVWVLSRAYRRENAEIYAALRLLLSVGNVITDRQTVEAGLAVLQAGGDFADGVLEHAGETLGAASFASFDRDAVKVLKQLGKQAFVPV
jgi:predicted nucleic-acid-binding protein